MNVKNTQTNTSIISKHQQLMVGLLGLFLLACGAVYCQHAVADTNVSGVEIEIITDKVDSNLVGDPVEDFLSDVNASEMAHSDTDDDLWLRIKDGYAMPNVKSQFATNHEIWYSSRPDYIKRMLERSQKYLFHIVEEVEKRGMPSEIALLPMIESAFNPQAYSRSAASGIWQFVPATGKHFGLQQNWWVDNRRDVTAATSAALTYLQKLHGMFGAWDLALAAYNAGEGTVQRAIDKNRRQGLPTDYQSLSLPPETKNYVPKLQAIKNIITNPEKFGLKINSIPNRPYFARVTTPKQIDAKLAAQLAEISFEEFSSLNPSYNRPVITSTGEKHQLLLPVWAAERFVENLANYDKPLTNWQTYNAKRGERMDNIAQKFGINVSQLRNVNGLSSANKLRNSQAVLVPANYNQNQQESLIDTAEMDNIEANSNEDDGAQNEPKQSRTVFYKVKRGETLQGLAKKHDTSTKALMQANKLKSSKVFAGQLIKVNQLVVKNGAYKSVSNKKTNVRIKSKNSRIKSSKTKAKRIKVRTNIRLR